MRSREDTACARSRPIAALLALAVVVCGSLTATPPPRASAADYEVEICTEDSKGGDGITVTNDGSGDSIITSICPPALETSIIRQEARPPVRGGEHWTLKAPEGTRIHELEANRTVTGGLTWLGGLEWRLVTGPDAGFRFLDRVDEDFEPIPSSGHVVYDVNSESVTGRLLCVRVECKDSFPHALMGSVVAIMEDQAPPTVTAAGPLLAGGPIRGVKEVSLVADDQGSGIAEAALFVDGELQAASSDGNEGKCEEPFKVLVPCKKHIESTFEVDTTGIYDGEHLVRVAALDASGQVGLSPPAIVTVHNAPANTALPEILGTARLGAQLISSRGSWEGTPTSFAYQWLQCDPSARTVEESNCGLIPGATKAEYLPGDADVYQRLAVAVIAKNDSGVEFAFSVPSEIVPDAQGRLAPDTTRPVLKASLSRTRFRVGGGSVRARPAAPRVPRGTALRFSSSEEGRLVVAIAAKRGGRRGRPLLLLRTIKAGRGRLPISGRIGRKRLTAGSYRLTAVVVDAAGNASRPSHFSFSVVPG